MKFMSFKLNLLTVIGLSLLVIGAGLNAQSIADVNYKGHDIGLINKHGWVFNSQDDMDKYLSEYYSHVGTVLNERYAAAVGYVENNSTTVRGYGYSIDISSPNDHILSTYGHQRPAIARKWREDDE